MFVTDTQLLRAFVEQRDEESFRELVRRHGDMVYSAARRQVGATQAEDVTQTVFVLLAQKARKMNGERLAGWLFQSCRWVALQSRRQDARRAKREEAAARMRLEASMNASQSDRWNEIESTLDGALARLSTADRCAITLRYLEGLKPAEVAASMGVSQRAADKRLQRAMMRLRKSVGQCGVVAPAAELGALLTVHARQTAPTSVMHRVANAALSGNQPIVRVSVAESGTLYRWIAAAVSLPLIVAIVFQLAPKNTSAQSAPQAPQKAKVGIIVSDKSANGVFPGGSTCFQWVQPIARFLRNPDIELYPVIEPGTEQSPKVADAIKKTFHGVAPVNGADAKAVGQLNAVVLFGSHLDEEALGGIEQAVKNGTGLVVLAGVGVSEPGYNDLVQRLLCLKDAKFGFNRELFDCEIASDHPILGKTSLKGHRLRFRPNGAYGVLTNGTALIRFVDKDVPGIDIDEGKEFLPLYVAQLGKGRVVGFECDFQSQQVKALERLIGGNLYLRCTRWAAGLPLD